MSKGNYKRPKKRKALPSDLSYYSSYKNFHAVKRSLEHAPRLSIFHPLRAPELAAIIWLVVFMGALLSFLELLPAEKQPHEAKMIQYMGVAFFAGWILLRRHLVLFLGILAVLGATLFVFGTPILAVGAIVASGFFFPRYSNIKAFEDYCAIDFFWRTIFPLLAFLLIFSIILTGSK